MKLKKFKEKDHKRIGIMVFTVVCILLVSGVILYRTFAIFEVKTNQNVINGQVQSMGDLEFAFYKNEKVVKEVPKKEEGYSLDTSSSYCVDLLNGERISMINWNEEKWSLELKNITTTKTKCYLYFKKIYQETILNGAIPDLGNGRLIPITFKDNGKVFKADITNTEDPWYKYAEQKWANAVILKDGVVDNYSSGQEILESDIESYFVWIPRYNYQIFDDGIFKDMITLPTADTSQIPNNVSEIQVTFGNIVYGTQKGDYLTHPAFTSFHSNGFWISKFEIGYRDASSTTEASKDTYEKSKVISKPNSYSWHGISISNAHLNSFQYQRVLDSHLIKNTEWGAVAYLTNSKYGRCNSNQCDEVRINNNVSYITGYAANFIPTCGWHGKSDDCNQYENIEPGNDGTVTLIYFNKASVLASTTGNYSGVYDLSGDTTEFVMSVMDKNGIPITGLNATNNSGFNGIYSQNDDLKTDGILFPEQKYIDYYTSYLNTNIVQEYLYGDAIREMGQAYFMYQYGTTNPRRAVLTWFQDGAGSLETSHPYITRGQAAEFGSEAGIFALGATSGSLIGTNQTAIGFRIVLTP